MAGQTNVTVRIISNRLPAIPGAARAQIAAEVKKAAFDVQAKAQSMAPVKTGTLRRSYHSVFSNGGLTGIVGTNLNYAPFVEFGTRHMPARPHIRPAAEAVLPGFAGRVKAILGKL